MSSSKNVNWLWQVLTLPKISASQQRLPPSWHLSQTTAACQSAVWFSITMTLRSRRKQAVRHTFNWPGPSSRCSAAANSWLISPWLTVESAKKSCLPSAKVCLRTHVSRGWTCGATAWNWTASRSSSDPASRTINSPSATSTSAKISSATRVGTFYARAWSSSRVLNRSISAVTRLLRSRVTSCHS